MRVTGPEVGLLHDTGHVTFAGGDAPTQLRKHVARVAHVHCKDVRPDVARLARNRGWSFLESVINGAFSTPGEGCVNFAAIVAILRDAGYRGWLVVEGERILRLRPPTVTRTWPIACCACSAMTSRTPRRVAAMAGRQDPTGSESSRRRSDPDPYAGLSPIRHCSGTMHSR
jgi:sugar phosphate isomerase/epimerase